MIGSDACSRSFTVPRGECSSRGCQMFTSLCNGLHRRVMAGPGSLCCRFTFVGVISHLFPRCLQLLCISLESLCVSVFEGTNKKGLQTKAHGSVLRLSVPSLSDTCNFLFLHTLYISRGHRYCKKVLGSAGLRAFRSLTFSLNLISIKLLCCSVFNKHFRALLPHEYTKLETPSPGV